MIMIETTYPVKIFGTVCLLRTFPSRYSICKQHVIPDVQHLHVVFSFFFFFVMISLIGNTLVLL